MTSYRSSWKRCAAPRDAYSARTWKQYAGDATRTGRRPPRRGAPARRFCSTRSTNRAALPGWRHDDDAAAAAAAVSCSIPISARAAARTAFAEAPPSSSETANFSAAAAARERFPRLRARTPREERGEMRGTITKKLEEPTTRRRVTPEEGDDRDAPRREALRVAHAAVRAEIDAAQKFSRHANAQNGAFLRLLGIAARMAVVTVLHAAHCAGTAGLLAALRLPRRVRRGGRRRRLHQTTLKSKYSPLNRFASKTNWRFWVITAPRTRRGIAGARPSPRRAASGRVARRARGC